MGGAETSNTTNAQTFFLFTTSSMKCTDIIKGQESKNVQISRAHLFLRKLPQTKNNNTPHRFVVLLCFYFAPSKKAKKTGKKVTLLLISVDYLRLFNNK